MGLKNFYLYIIMVHRSLPTRNEYYDVVTAFFVLLILLSNAFFFYGLDVNWLTLDNAGYDFLTVELGLSAGVATLFTVLTVALYFATNLNLRLDNYGSASFALGTAASALCAFIAWLFAAGFLFTTAETPCGTLGSDQVPDAIFVQLGGDCNWVYASEALAVINILASFGCMIYGALVTFQNLDDF